MESIKFDNTNVLESLGLVLVSKDIGLPSLKTVTIEVPARDGVVDITERLYGGAKYGNRRIKLTFENAKGILSSDSWEELLTKVSNLLHGKKKKIIFSTDPEWYYTGRCSVDSFEVKKKKRTIVISCDCDPYKYKLSDPSQKTL